MEKIKQRKEITFPLFGPRCRVPTAAAVQVRASGANCPAKLWESELKREENKLKIKNK